MENSDSKPSILAVLDHYQIDTTRLHEDRGWRQPKILCPNPEHDDSSPSCGINTSLQRYHCWSCGSKGDSVDLIALLEGVEIAEAFAIARRDFGLEGAAVPRASAKPAPWRPARWAGEDD